MAGQRFHVRTAELHGRALRGKYDHLIRNAIDTQPVLGVCEGYAMKEAEDIAAALRKVELHYIK